MQLKDEECGVGVMKLWKVTIVFADSRLCRIKVDGVDSRFIPNHTEIFCVNLSGNKLVEFSS